MVPFIFLGLAAVALSTLGCSPAQRPPPSAPPPPPKDPEEEPLPPKFLDDDKAKWLHLQLKLAGIKDSELDRGCLVIHYPTQGFQFNKTLGAGDRLLQPCELYEFTLDRYEDPKFRPLAEELAGRPIPWALDDHDPKTTEDAELRLKIQKVIERLGDSLKQRGLKPGQQAYQESMAVALMAYLTIPQVNFQDFKKRNLNDLDPKSRRVREAFEKLAREMEELGLGKFWEEWETQGGLGPASGDYSRELSALEALRPGQVAECTERSKIEYAVFKMAGLNPQFLFVDPWKSENRGLELEMLNIPDAFHVAVGLKFGDKFRILDSSLVDSSARHHGFLALSLRQYLAIDFNNRGYESKLKGDLPQAETQFIWAMDLDPSSFLPLANLAALRMKEDPQKAMELVNAALGLNPRSPDLYFVRGLIWEKLENMEEALKDINHAISLNSRSYKYFMFRGVLFLKTNKIGDAERDFVITLRLTPLKSGKELLEILIEIITLSMEQNLGKEKLKSLEEDTGLIPARAAAAGSLALFYWRADQREFALEIIKEFSKELSLQRDMLKKEKKEFSPTALDFLKSLYQILPSALRADPEFKALWDPLGLKF